jgi:cytochrome c biogenesis protein CcmG/thiol:disulfide interchange protein DsbE
MRRVVYFLPIFVLIFLTFLLIWGMVGRLFTSPPTHVGKTMPEFSFALYEKKTTNPILRKSKELKGTPFLVTFFASWCSICQEEQPLLNAYKKKLGIRLLGVNVKDHREALEYFLAKYGNPFDTIILDSEGRLVLAWGVLGYPETFLVDEAGIIQFHHQGALTTAMIEEQILPLLEKLSYAKKP